MDEPTPGTDDPGGAHAKGYSADPGPEQPAPDGAPCRWPRARTSTPRSMCPSATRRARRRAAASRRATRPTTGSWGPIADKGKQAVAAGSHPPPWPAHPLNTRRSTDRRRLQSLGQFGQRHGERVLNALGERERQRLTRLGRQLTQIILVVTRQDHVLDAVAMRRQHLLLDAAD